MVLSIFHVLYHIFKELIKLSHINFNLILHSELLINVID